MLQEGQKAPNFTLQATGGRSVSLSDFRSKRNVVIYFYHQDDAPVCTQQTCDFRDHQPDFEGFETVILGISSDNIIVHDTFARRNKVKFNLLADDGKVVWRAYASDPKTSEERLTVVIDKEGIIRKVWPQVSVPGHVDEVLAFISQIQ